MIARTAPSVHTTSWQQLLRDAIRTPDELFHALGLEGHPMAEQISAHQEFPVVVPAPYLARIERGNPEDPLLLQVLPDVAEMQLTEGYNSDPLSERDANPLPGLIHKYHNRVLLTLASHCAINCRYCFRRHFPYKENAPGRQQWLDVLEYIRSRPEIDEVIYSGGEPLAVNDQRLAWLSQQLSGIPHLKRLRIHTRMPIAIPQRVNQELRQWISASRLQVVMVIHCNHPNELDTDTVNACKLLQRDGVTLLNQSVLLRGINDNVSTLIELSERLFAAGISPYYLHLLDKVQGAAHFDIERHQAIALIDEMRTRCSGYLVPALAQENAGMKSKTVLG